MSDATALMVSAAQLLNAGTLAMEQFQTLAAKGEDITQDDLNAEIDRVQERLRELRDND